MVKDSQSSIQDATRSRADFSGHHGAKGAAGHHDDLDASANKDAILVSTAGEDVFVDPQDGGYEDIKVSLSWDNLLVAQGQGFWDKLFRRAKKGIAHKGVDIDLGCLYELHDGSRDCLQAFGDLYGNLNKPPWVRLSGDERTGDTEGVDEYMLINGQKWPEIKRILFYIYIYEGATDWQTIKPEIFIDIPGDEDLRMTPHARQSDLSLCAVGELENIRGGMKLTNHSEYFPGHAEMDRAFGYGINWEEGTKE